MKWNFYIQPRFIILTSIVIALIMIVGTFYQSMQTEQEIYKVLEKEALSLVETIENSSINIILSSEEIERQIAERLLTAARLIAQLDNAKFLLKSDLNRIANENNIFLIYLFDKNGRIILSNHTLNIDDQKTAEKLHSKEILKPILNNETDYIVIGTNEAQYEDGERFAVAVRRTNPEGGAIVVNIDITSFANLKKTIGIGRLLRDLGNNSGIEYAALQDEEGIIAASESVDQLSSISSDATLADLLKKDTVLTRHISFHKRKVYEVLKPLNLDNSRIGIIRIGLSLDEVRAIQQQAQQRNLMRTVVLILIAFLTIAAFIAAQKYILSRQKITSIESFYSNILEQMRDTVVTIDNQKRITLFNQQAESLFGIKAKNVIGKSIAELPEILSKNLELIYNSKESELTIELPKDQTRTISISLSKINKEDGSIESQTVLIKDLTELRRMEKEIQRKDKLSAMGELASGVAHEIRNPLNAISMIAQRYEKEFVPTKNKKEYGSLTKVLRKETARVNDIIQQFLSFARPPKLRIESVSVKEFTSHVNTLFKNQVKNIGIDFSSSCEINKSISIDRNQMMQALQNILQNALEATKKGGKIALRVYQKDNAVFFEVKDTGSGIPSNQLEKIFNLYFTTKSDGNGIGLAVTQQIVSQHGGTIEVQSRLGRGSAFTIRIPL